LWKELCSRLWHTQDDGDYDNDDNDDMPLLSVTQTECQNY